MVILSFDFCWLSLQSSIYNCALYNNIIFIIIILYSLALMLLGCYYLLFELCRKCVNFDKFIIAGFENCYYWRRCDRGDMCEQRLCSFKGAFSCKWPDAWPTERASHESSGFAGNRVFSLFCFLFFLFGSMWSNNLILFRSWNLWIGRSCWIWQTRSGRSCQ